MYMKRRESRGEGECVTVMKIKEEWAKKKNKIKLGRLGANVL
jgi:hypothetical protein